MERYIGKMLDNRYEILEVIGTGGMAVVFKAKCHRLNRMVAIKMLKKDLSEDAEFRRRFHDESQAVAMLSHPNIMAVYDVSRRGDMDYIVMELIDGITLKQYMERRGRLNWPESLHFITQIMKGLSHAHSRGIVHRDIKPQNIMVLRDGTVKVTDFGIAFLSNGSNPSNEAIGSVHYISPEQAKGDYTDNRSDIYSAGVVLYEMLTSRLPFEGSDPVSVAIQHFSAVPLSPREIDPEIPEALEQICMKAMAPDRNKRYSTADEMLADLEAFRKDPNINFEYSAEELRRETGGGDEPTQYIPNTGVTRTKQNHYTPPVEDDDDDEYYDKPRSNWWKILILILIVAGVGYFGVLKMYNSIMDSFQHEEIPEYQVPSVVGMTIEEAEELETVKGIFELVEESHEHSLEYPEGQIIRQSPEAERIRKNAGGELIPINVTVSLGSRSGEMVTVVGDEARSARLRIQQTQGLSELHLNIVEAPEQEFHDEIEAGCVIRTEPAAGTLLKEGDTVTLYVSKGPKIIYSTMVSCLGETVEWAQDQMNSLNLVAEFTKVESSEPEGTVLSQSIDTGEEVPEGTTVTFTYSDGEKLLEYPITFDVPYSEEPVLLQLFLDGQVIADQEVPGDYGTFSHTLRAKAGSHRLQIYAANKLFWDEEILFQ
ncbi:MAG: Stk1 family PASTA domain-containing Ser/Thr kinase [Oscillospiraceae bacterium]|jgi:serine/threonine protein kinase/beta-lactam-binding protein with PASTA domain|nr:Stk1 family PASTA domain-containing Ser/Thr kinase [Oscillospiraceae bacterium]